MKLHLAAILSLLLALSTGAAEFPASQFPVQSASGQFSVRVVEAHRHPFRDGLDTASDLLPLDPSLLIVSAERLRQYLALELGDTSPWQGRILFSLYPSESLDAPFEVLAQWQGNGWRYEVSMPDHIDRVRFIRLLVEVNLMEMANRTSSGRATPVPAWLTEGLTGYLLVSRSVEIILPPPKMQVRGIMKITPWIVQSQSYDPLALAHSQLQTNMPLTIEQLSWPTPESFLGRKGESYRNCAQLLVSQLLKLPQGAELLNAFIRNLGRHYNWQVAFLDTYHAQFPTLLDFEKWWALQVALFTGRDLGTTYSYLNSVSNLNQVLHFPVQIRLHNGDMPMHGEVRLQTIIEEWDVQNQQQALERTLTQLSMLRARIAPELVGLLDDYRLTLEDYLRQRNRTGLYLPRGINRQVALKAMVHRTLRTLDGLDAELGSLMPEPTDSRSVVDSNS